MYRAKSKKSAQRLEERTVAAGHVHLKHEPPPWRPVLERGQLGRDEEGALGCDETTERESDRVPRSEESWKKLGGADATRTRDFHHAMVALYQLSYSPRAVQGTSGHSGLERLADRTHVCIMTSRYDIYP